MGASGFPMFFEMNKLITYILFFLSVTYFVPMMFFWSSDYNSIIKNDKKNDPDFNDINIFSIGIFIYDPVTPVGIRYFNPKDRINDLTWVGRFLGLTVFVNLLMLIYVRRKLL